MHSPSIIHHETEKERKERRKGEAGQGGCDRDDGKKTKRERGGEIISRNKASRRMSGIYYRVSG